MGDRQLDQTGGRKGMNQLLVHLRQLFTIAVGELSRLAVVQVRPPFILCYHGIGNSSYAHDVTKREFAKQMHYLATHYHLVTLDDIVLHLRGKKQLNDSVAITFDDGYASIMKIVDILAKYNVKPTVFVMSDQKGVNRQELANNHPLLSTKELRKLIKLGWTIGSHTVTHPDLTKLSKQQLVEEITGSKLGLERVLNAHIKYFAYPRGRYTKEAANLVTRSGYHGGFTMDDHELTPGLDRYTIGRIGINHTHSLQEFQSLSNPWVMRMRKIIKGTGYGT